MQRTSTFSQGMEGLLCLTDILLSQKNQYDKGLYFIENGQEHEFISYAELFNNASDLLNVFYAAGISAGDEMILVEESNKLLLTAFWACQLGNIIPVPVSVGNKDSHRLKLLHIWNELANPYIFTRKDYLDKWMLFVKEQELSCTTHLPEERFIDVINHAVVIPGIATMPAPATPDDLAFIQYSSGSTGTPKGVMLTHKNLLYNISAVAERMEATGDDNMISWIPLTHDLGMIAFHLTASLTGCNQYIMPTSLFIRRPLLWMELTHKYKATISFSPNFGYQYFLNALSKAEQTDWDLSSLRLILNGAEPILAAVCRDFTRTLAAWKLSPHIINAAYGLAEASVGVTGYGPHTPLKEYFIPRTALQYYQDLGTLHTTPQNGYVSFVTVGKPIAHCQVRICDDENQELLCNRVGHIQIKGENVTAGYYNKLLNEDLFTADGWLRTGDLGFMDQDGELVITGREKNIIILQGQNYYNQDIEQLLFGIDDIALGKVVACADVGKGNEGESFLVFVLYKKPTASFVEVIRQINTRLSNHLGIVPEHIIPVKEIPKTTSGKVQHRALVEKYRNGDFAAEIAMLSEQYNMRTRLTELWQDVFGKDTVDDKENFFTAGGNSLLAMQLLSQISIRLNKQITLRQLFEHASIDQLEQLLQGISSQVLPPEIVAAAQQAHYPLSHQQLQFWTAEKLSGDGSMHNIFKAYNYSGGLDAGVLQTAVELLLQRHEVLRMRITEIDGEPRQSILSMKEGLPVFFYHDLRAEVQGQKTAEEAIQKMIGQSLDLENDALFSVHVFQYNESEGLLFFLMHHIVGDGWSAQVILNDLVKIYAAGKASKSPVLPDLYLQYKDYAVWQHEVEPDDRSLEQSQSFWKHKLEGNLSRIALPTFGNRPEQASSAGQVIRHTLPVSLSKQILDFAADHQVTAFNVLMAVTNVLFHKYTGLNDILIGTAVSGRNTAILQQQVGLYIDTVPLRTQIDPAGSFLDLVTIIRAELTEVLDYQSFPFSMMERERANGPMGLFDILIEYQAYDHEAAAVFFRDEHAVTTLEPLDLDNGTSLLGMNLEFIQVGDVLNMRYCYNTDTYTSEDINRFTTHFEKLSADLLNAPEEKLSAAGLMTDAERQWLDERNDKDQLFPLEKTADQLIDEMAQLYPGKTAVLFNKRNVTYQELQAGASQLAALLNGYALTESQNIVGVLMDRSPEMMATIYGTWKAGLAYVPVHPTLPEDRMDFMLQDAASGVLVTERKYLAVAERLAARRGTIHIIIAEEQGYLPLDSSAAGALSPASNGKAEAESLAYVIYTSGSTGNPKGAMVEHRGMVNHIFSKIEALGLNTESIVAQNASQSFDISVWQFFAALVAGGTVVVYEQDMILDVAAFVDAIEEDQVTVLEVVPSYLSVILDEVASMPEQKIFTTLLWLMVTGETVKQRLLARWFEQFTIPVVNAYGPTEASDDITHHFMYTLPENLNIPIGKVLPNFKIYIVDPAGNLCPAGVTGEIWVSGVGVGKGYLNDPVKTAKVFTTDPFRKEPGTRLYKTGDIGRYLPDGTIEFLGRVDHQVKIRGNRIELEEIEAHLTQLAAVKEAVVLVREDHGTPYLVAYITTLGTEDTQLIRSMLADKLPEYMLPEWIMVLQHMPLTPNGKIDRQSLALLVKTDDVEKEWKAPRTATEIAMANIWKEVLDQESIAADDDFFMRGGQSLKATRLVSMVYRQMETKISVKDVFTSPVLTDLAALVDRISDKQFIPIVPVKKNNTGIYPASNAQKRLWLIDQLEENLVAYNAYAAFELKGPMDIQALDRAVAAVGAQHEILRTTFIVENGELMQRVHEKDKFILSLNCKDYRNGAKDSEAVIAELKQQAHTAMDLATDPLFQATVCLMPDDTCYFFCMMHHIICDGWSNNLLIQEVFQHYHIFAGHQQAIPEKQAGIQYKDYTIWQQAQFQTPLFETHKKYWQSVFSDELPVLEMPTLKDRPATKTYNGHSIIHQCSAEELAVLQGFARDTGGSLFMVLHALLNVLLYKYTGQRDIVIGTITSGRTHPDLEEQIGYFLNTVPLRNQIDPESNFHQWLLAVTKNTLEAFEHQDYPFDMLVNDLDITRDMSRNPLFDVALILQNFDHDEAGMVQLSLEQFQINTLNLEGSQSMFDLDFEFQEVPGGLQLKLNYNTDIYERQQMEVLINHLGILIDQLERAPEHPIGHLSLLTDEDKKIYQQRHTLKDYPLEQTYFHYLEKFAMMTPDKPAMVYRDTSLSYAALNARVNQLAWTINSKAKLAQEELVGIFMNRSEKMAACILAVWKSGAAYLPLERKLPDNKIITILQEAGVKHILAERDCMTQAILDALEGQCEVIYVEDLLEAASVAPVENYKAPVSPRSLAFVIFTSGSTGKPKGAMLEHLGKMNHAHNSAEYLEMDADTVLVQNASHGFDISVWQFFNAFVNGGTTVVYDDALVNDPENFLQQLISDKASVLLVVPSYLSLLLDVITVDPSLYPLPLKYLDCGGEIVKPSLVKRWFDCYPHIPMVNDYGPTEASDSTSYNVLHPADVFTDKVPIGRSLHNMRSYVVDAHMNLVPDGIIGELCVGGIGVGRGYLNDTVKTAAAFMEDPFVSGGERLYKTGDRARYLPDGLIELHGRQDHQVKINGHRIELGEIEARLAQLPYINDAVVLDKEDEKGRKYLVAFVVLLEQQEVSYTNIKELVSHELPAYMIPGKFHFMEAIPITINGKADRNALARITLVTEETVIEAPATPLEQVVALAWEAIFKRPATNMQENFYQAGGDSITAIKLASQISRQGYKAEIRDIMMYPTIRGLAPYLTLAGHIANQDTVTGKVPLTPIQKDFFAAAKVNPHHFHQSVLVYSKSGINFDSAGAAWKMLQEWHDALRMSYSFEGDDILQYNKDKEETVALEWQAITATDVRAAIEQQAIAQAGTIHLSNGPLLKGTIFHTNEGDYLLLLIHHLIIDGVSWRILMEDFVSLYESAEKGRELVLPAKTESFRQWAEELEIYTGSEELAGEKAYWEKVVAGMAENRSTFEQQHAVPERISELQRCQVILSEAYTRELTTNVHQAFNTNINDLLLTALASATQQQFRLNEVGVMLESHGRVELREQFAIDRTIGWFTSEYPVLLAVNESDDFGRQIKIIKEYLHHIPNRGIGYGLLRHQSRIPDLRDTRPAILFNYLGHVDEYSLGDAFEWLGNVGAAEEDPQNKAEYPVEISGIVSKGQLALSIFYHPSRFDAGTMQQWGDKYIACLQQLIDYCTTRSGSELTPSDFAFDGLSIDELEELNDMLS